MELGSIFDFTDKKVFITGAGRGIGRGIAEVFARAGADVAINALTTTHVEPAAVSIAASSGRRVVPIVRDLTTPPGVSSAVAEVVDRIGGIDVLVNCLGDAIRGPLNAATDADVELSLNLNLVSAILCCRAVGPLFEAQHRGKVVNVSSALAVRGGAEMSVYTASKMGIVGLTRALALEWAPNGVQVNAVAPGIFPDPVLLDGARDAFAARAATIPARRLGDPSEVGYLALYLASPAADYVTGQTIFIDGGMTL